MSRPGPRTAGMTVRPARRKGKPTKYGNVASRMQTSLQRRNARRRKGGRGRSGGAARTAAVALPLFLFATFLAVAGVAFVGAVSAYAYYARDLDEPTALEDIAFNQQSIIYDRTGKIELGVRR